MYRSRTAAGSRLAPAVAVIALGITSTTASSVAFGDAPGGEVGYGAMPGGLHVATAETLPEGTVELAMLSGFGYRKGLLAADHVFERALGDVAVAYAPLPGLAIGLSLDGRYDTHEGFAAMTDHGYVGDPHGLVRLGRSFGRVALAGQLGIWVPGKDAPSVAASAISIDARGLLSFDAGFGTLSLDAGVRLDNSASSVDHPEQLSAEDRVSLGVSDWSAAIGGVSLRVPLGGRAYAALEASTDVFVGSGAPGPILRGGAEVGIAISETFTAVGFVEAAKVPGLAYSGVMAGDVVLVPYEPSVTGGLGLQARFGGSRAAGGSHIVEDATLVPGEALEPMLPPGQLRAVIINLGTSRPVAGAGVTLAPGGVTATSGPDGKVTVDLPPGHYKLTVTARGLAPQQLDVTIEQNGVAIKNIELHR